MRGEGLEIFCKKISGEDAYKGPENIIYLPILWEKYRNKNTHLKIRSLGLTMLLRKYKNSALMDSYLSHVYSTEGMNHCLKEFFTEDNHQFFKKVQQ